MTRPYDPEAIGIVVLLGQWAAKSPEERAAVLRDLSACDCGAPSGSLHTCTALPGCDDLEMMPTEEVAE